MSLAGEALTEKKADLASANNENFHVLEPKEREDRRHPVGVAAGNWSFIAQTGKMCKQLQRLPLP
ncbi:MAG: hypothetical protein C0621_00715 [Desulfuromonas sp.]|nr:MAG: hypothetical protein C0621_00715 [Desulfuromonas sp.]